MLRREDNSVDSFYDHIEGGMYFATLARETPVPTRQGAPSSVPSFASRAASGPSVDPYSQEHIHWTPANTPLDDTRRGIEERTRRHAQTMADIYTLRNQGGFAPVVPRAAPQQARPAMVHEAPPPVIVRGAPNRQSHLAPVPRVPEAAEPKQLVGAMREWEGRHPVGMHVKDRPARGLSEEQSDALEGKPLWAFPRGMLSPDEARAAYTFMLMPEDKLNILNTKLEARLPNQNDKRGIDSPERFAYLERGLKPKQYLESVKNSVSLVKRVGQMFNNMALQERARSIAAAPVYRALEERAVEAIIEPPQEAMQATELGQSSPAGPSTPIGSPDESQSVSTEYAAASVRSRQQAVYLVRRAFQNVQASRARRQVPLPDIVPRTSRVTRALARSSPSVVSEALSAPAEIGRTQDLWRPRTPSQVDEPIVNALAPTSVASSQRATPNAAQQAAPPSFASLDQMQPPPAVPEGPVEVYVPLAEETVDVRVPRRTKDAALKGAQLHLGLFSMRVMIMDKYRSQAGMLGQTLCVPALHLTFYERLEQVNSIKLGSRSMYDFVGQQFVSALDFYYFDSTLLQPVSCSVMDQLAKLCSDVSAPASPPSLGAIAQTLAKSIYVWPSLLSLRQRIISPQTFSSIVDIQRQMYQQLDTYGHMKMLYETPKNTRHNAHHTAIFATARLYDAVEALEAEEPNIYQDLGGYYVSLLYYNVLIDIVRRTIKDSYALKVFKHTRYHSSQSAFVNSDSRRNNHYAEFTSHISPVIELGAWRRQGVSAMLCQHLLPGLYDAYLACMQHVLISQDEQEKLYELRDTFGRTDLYRAVSEYFSKPADAESADAHSPRQRMKTARNKQLELFAAYFAETVEIVCIIAVMFLVPLAPLYRKMWEESSNRASAAGFKIDDGAWNALYNSYSIVYYAQILCIRTAQALIDSLNDPHSTQRAHVAGVYPVSASGDSLVYDVASAKLAMRSIDPLTNLIGIVAGRAPRPMRPRGVYSSDIPAMANYYILGSRIPEHFSPFFFKIQNEWTRGHALEQYLVKTWHKYYKSTQYKSAFAARDPEGDPTEVYGVFASRMPKQTLEEQRRVRALPVAREDDMTEEQWYESLREERQRQREEARDERRALKRQTKFIRIHTRPKTKMNRRDRQLFMRHHGLVDMEGEMRAQRPREDF